jgi:hypothetical protein
VFKISAFLFAALIFFVSFFYQEKKEKLGLQLTKNYLADKCIDLMT